MGITKGEWVRDDPNFHLIAVLDDEGAYKYIANCDPYSWSYSDMSDEEMEANANLIVSAVNACVKVNKDNPVAVAEGIVDLYEVCKEMRNFLYGYSENKKELYQKASKVLAKVKGK